MGLQRLSRHAFPPSNSTQKTTNNSSSGLLSHCQTLLSDGAIAIPLASRSCPSSYLPGPVLQELPAISSHIFPQSNSTKNARKVVSSKRRFLMVLKILPCFLMAGWLTPKAPASCPATPFHHLIPHKKRPTIRPRGCSPTAKRRFLTAVKIIFQSASRRRAF